MDLEALPLGIQVAAGCIPDLGAVSRCGLLPVPLVLCYVCSMCVCMHVCMSMDMAMAMAMATAMSMSRYVCRYVGMFITCMCICKI